jgi:metallo-beta-lactamase class B
MIEDICIHPWNHWVDPFCIAGDLYYVGNKNVSSHLIDTGEGLILLDTAFPQSVYMLLESVRRLGFDPMDIRQIVNTHAHYDHFGGTRAIMELTGAKTVLGKHDAFILTDRPELSWAPEYGPEFYETFEVDRLLSDGDKITLGRTTIDCVHIPGHTPGTMSYFFQICDKGKNYTVGIHGGAGGNTLTDEYLTKYGLSTEVRRHYAASLAKLRARNVDIMLGAHPILRAYSSRQNDTSGKRDRMTDGNNPFINKEVWPTYLSCLEAYSSGKPWGKLWARLRAM